MILKDIFINASHWINHSVLCIVILLSAVPNILTAQQSPSSINWKSIDAGNYQIIFPEKITFQGQKVANLMNYFEQFNYKSLKTSPRKIPIVLINQYAAANGFVSPAPFYSHWFTTPAPFDSIEWFNGLAVHEGRHMVQMNKLTDGAGKYTWRVLMGASGSALFSAFYIPVWFMEGDAVTMETALTSGGRGRMPSFNSWERALLLSGKQYSYYRAYLGSYDDMYPNSDHYRLGYMMCSYVRRHYGTEAWDKVLSLTGKYFLFPTFDYALKDVTGRDILDIYNDMFQELKKQLIKQQKNLHITETSVKSPVDKNKWESWLMPYQETGGSILTVRYRKDDVTTLVRINNDGSCEEIKQLPSQTSGAIYSPERSISIANGKALWKENVPDPRWGYRSWSELTVLDINNGKQKRITSGGKYLSFALSPDASKIAGIEYGTKMKYILKILDSNGKKLQQNHLKKYGFLFDPAWSADSKNIVFASLAPEGNSICQYNLKNREIKPLFKPVRNERFRNPVFWKNYVLYGSDYSGIDNIYAIDVNTGKKYQITSRPVGAYYPSVRKTDNSLYFNDYTVNGYHVNRIELDKKKWIPLGQVQKAEINTIDPIVAQEAGRPVDTESAKQNKQYKVKDYSPLLHSINFYGWNLISDKTNLSLTFTSDDFLHTTHATVGYIYNYNEKTHAGLASLTYSGLYPVISVSGGYGERSVKNGNFIKNINDRETTWTEGKVYGDISIPLSFKNGIHRYRITPLIRTGYIHVRNKNNQTELIYESMNKDGDLHFMQYSLNCFHLVENNSQAVNHRWGQILNLSYSHTPFLGEYRGSILSANLDMFFPGLWRTHSIQFEGSYEWRPEIPANTYSFASAMGFPRGYDAVAHKQFIKGSFQYSFPLINISIPVWKLLYFKRINGALFFDYGAGLDKNKYTNYPSTGVELTTEFNILSNKYIKLEMGGRYSFAIEGKDHKFDVVVKSMM